MTDWSALEECRRELDKIDAEIIRLFGERYNVRRRVKKIKHDQHLPVQDPARVKIVIDQVLSSARQHNVPLDFAEALYELVIDYSHKFEE
ncbi:MAG TPA: chorismate mutase [Alphaproteobacteria bacterium]